MAINFSLRLDPTSVGISIPGTEFQKTIDLTLSGELGGLGDDLDAFRHLTRALHREAQRRFPVRYPLVKLFHRFDYAIAGGQDLEDDYLQELALRLQLHLRMRHLLFNGRDLALPLWRRTLEFWIQLLLVEVLPLSAMLLSAYFMPDVFRANPVVFLLVLFIVLYMLRFLGTGAWTLAFKAMLPSQYLRVLIASRRRKPGLFERFWIRLVWGISGPTRQ